MRPRDRLALRTVWLAAALALAATMGPAPGPTARAAPAVQLPLPTPTPSAGTEVTLLPGEQTIVVPGLPPSPPTPSRSTRRVESLRALQTAGALATAVFGQTQPAYALALVMLLWPGLYLPIPTERQPHGVASPRSPEEGSHVEP